MAKSKDKKLNLLTPEQQQVLIAQGDKIAKAEAAIALLKDLGLGTVELENKLQWAKTQRDTLLERG